MQKRIAIVSPHEAPNYGTMLQAYGLQKALSQLGCESEYICYNPRPMGLYLVRFALEMLLKSPNSFIRKLCGIPIGDNFRFFYDDNRFSSTWQAFTIWHNSHICCTKEIYNHSNIVKLENEVSLFLVGSDQTWSPLLTKWNTVFYLNFLKFVRDGKKKAAYAPSFGTFRFSKSFQKRMLNALSSFTYLSCREAKGAHWLEQNLNRAVKSVLDPTLLLPIEDWDKVSLPVLGMPAQYVLCYQLGEKKSISEFAKHIGQMLDLPVYHILTRPTSLSYSNCLSGIGPGEFISLIRGASCVCTDSFHGTIFCINYNIPFFSFTKRKANDPLNDNERIINVLEEFGLESRFRCDEDDNVDLNFTFDRANEIMFRRRQESLNYLKQIADASKSN